MMCKSIKSLSSEKKFKDAKISNVPAGETITTVDNSSEIDVHSFKFITNHLPKCKQIFFQLTNIELEEAKEIINRRELKDYCDEKDGWWKIGTIDKLRSLMLAHVDKILEGERTEKLSKNSRTESKDLEDEEVDDEEIDDDEDEEIMQYYE